MKFAGPCFQHQLYRPGLGFCVLMSSFCHLATHQVWYHWTTSPCFWAVTSQTVSLDGGNKKGLNADANTSHFHVFLWKKKDRLFWVKKQKPSVFVDSFYHLFVGAGLEAFWGRQPGFGCPCWVGYVESSCFRSHLFETMRFGAIWFTPDKTLGYVWNWADHSEVISISPGTLADWDVSTPGQTADSLFSRRLLSGESVSNSFTLQSPPDAKHNEVMHMFKKRMRLQL